MADKHYEQWLADFPQSSSYSDSDSDDEEDESLIEIAAALIILEANLRIGKWSHDRQLASWNEYVAKLEHANEFEVTFRMRHTTFCLLVDILRKVLTRVLESHYLVEKVRNQFFQRLLWPWVCDGLLGVPGRISSKCLMSVERHFIVVRTCFLWQLLAVLGWIFIFLRRRMSWMSKQVRLNQSATMESFVAVLVLLMGS
jgi:hypothetical protein